MFTQFDIVVSIITLFFVVLGFFNGAVKTVFSIGKWVGAWYLTTRYYPEAREFVESFMQPGMVANAVAVGGLGIISLVGIAIAGSMISAAVAGTIGGSLDKVLGIALGVLEGFLIASIMHYCTILFKNGETPDWLAEGQTYRYTARGADMFDKLLKGKLDNIKIAYDEGIANFTDKIQNKDKYDMDALSSEIAKMSKSGASEKEITSKLNNEDFMNQFLKIAESMKNNVGKAPKGGDSENLMKNFINDAPPLEISPDSLD
jgi:membrane protein required for colicin V production